MSGMAGQSGAGDGRLTLASAWAAARRPGAQRAAVDPRPIPIPPGAKGRQL